jgi:hypothetical protein
LTTASNPWDETALLSASEQLLLMSFSAIPQETRNATLSSLPLNPFLLPSLEQRRYVLYSTVTAIMYLAAAVAVFLLDVAQSRRERIPVLLSRA